MNTVEGINSWLLQNKFDGVVSLLIIIAILFGATSIVGWLWNDHRWYLYLSLASSAIVFPWMACELKKQDEGPR